MAADANNAGQVYPDQVCKLSYGMQRIFAPTPERDLSGTLQSLYPANSVPLLVKRINQALQRADQIEHAEGGAQHDW